MIGAGGGMGDGQRDRYAGFGALVAAAATAATPEAARTEGHGGAGAGADAGDAGDGGAEGVHVVGGGRPGFGSDDLASERSRRSSGGFTQKLGQLFSGRK